MAEIQLLAAPPDDDRRPSDDRRPPDSAWQRMHALRSAWPEGDGVAVFNGLCLSGAGDITASYGGGYPTTAATRDAAALRSSLAERYLAAVDAVDVGGRAPAAWRPLFQHRRHPGVRPAQFALAGVNAHVGHDLALAVVDLCRARGCEPPALETAFARVGDALTLLVDRVGEQAPAGPDAGRGPGVEDPVTHLLGAWNVERALEAAWSSALVLWGLREVPPLAEEFRERMDAGVGLVGRCLLTPYG
ncbi:hypothetical protein GCM10011583_43380 [Streptomyces camponoticapitis]|uniref:Uncharacterized protein n=1 Tax=Streptomyces camponoticapitis TaxID=1616125 RepID=A0ABQ2EDM4_9ACTN|nr:DUF5995 family protein [Streptomyces camponoticapitis]GGK06983.1 hypothetical protein GCM10011583_43380 [Streptomyces camponoticapitis]